MRPIVRCLVESWALKEEREGKDGGSLAEAGLALREAHETPRGARGLLYLLLEAMGPRQASWERMEVGVEKKLFMVHLWTLCQKPFMPLSAA